MKNFKTLIAELSEAMWPGTPEYKKKYGETPSDSGSRHNIDRSSGVVRATRKYDSSSGESEEPTKNREDAAAAPVKRGRGRPPGKYGSYKKKVKESIEILEALETEEDIEEFIYSLDEESFSELEDYLSLDEEVEEIEELSKNTLQSYKDKATQDARSRASRDADLENTRGALRDLTTTQKTFSSTSAPNYRPRASERLKSADPELHKHLSGILDKLKADSKAQKAKNKTRYAGINRATEKLKEEVELDEELKGGQHRIDVNKNGKLDAEDFKKLRRMKKKPDGTLHNCATHVEHAVYGKGQCIKEEHAAPDEAGDIAWYTVKFDDGSVRKMQTESMKIVASESHKHESVEVQVDESVNRYAAFISTENK